ncbi:MAG: UDP-N-acetylglucosamine 2-epimerase (non-hydrolyzing) [Burkholderiales bacterium]|nr:UDP-N-acetylglucosamine 2-epimerase (non-hydrolyzing) [Burkholderiales bacterium]
MARIVTVVGARPQFVKAAPVGRALRQAGHHEYLVHTGQHYDDRMSAVFFDELGLCPPDCNLGIGSGPHGAQTGAMLGAIEAVIQREAPDHVLVYGDTNSTLAAALAAAKLGRPVAHVEAGLRSFDRRMPEEVNRVLVDHVAQLLLAPSPAAVRNLAAEGIVRGVHEVGDVMAEAVADAARRLPAQPPVLRALGIAPGAYLLVTVHRAENTDDPQRLRAIMAALEHIDDPVVFPVHPRTRKALAVAGWAGPSRPGLHLVEPVGYLDMVGLQLHARAILTDSGGVQKEAYWLGRPCLTLRDNTEWVETVAAGWNTLVGADTERIVAAVRDLQVPGSRPPLYGEGDAAARIAALL